MSRLRNSADVSMGEAKQTLCSLDSHIQTHTHRHRNIHVAAFRQHESTFMFRVEQTEKGFTFCVYLQYVRFHDGIPFRQEETKQLFDK